MLANPISFLTFLSSAFERAMYNVLLRVVDRSGSIMCWPVDDDVLVKEVKEG